MLIGIVGIYFLSNLGVISGDGIIRYDFLRVFAYFLLGVGFYKCIFNKDGAIVIVLGLILILFFEGDFLEFGISLSLVLLIAFFGFSKKNFIKKWSSFDLSYGMYVYAWPVSQITANMNNSIYIKLIVATGFLILLSYFSFNYIEKPLLKKKKFFKEIKINGV